jgi:hypothetical protein
MIAHNREDGGKLVRDAWIEWAQSESDPKPSWLVPWDGLREPDKEADRQIWEKIVDPYAPLTPHELKYLAQLVDEDTSGLQDDSLYIKLMLAYNRSGEEMA